LSRIKEDTSISMNDIGRVSIHSTEPLFLDPYQTNRVTGSFILIDEDSKQTAAAGMVLPPRT
jgi:sulfate adenylyltransferase subunit 1 (EFTu-like GTPase family)